MTQGTENPTITIARTGALAPTTAGRIRKGRFRAEWRNPIGLVGAAIVLFTVLLAVFAPVISPYSPSAQGSGRLQEPRAAHWMGIDELGRDQLSRIVYGARVSLQVGAIMLVVLGFNFLGDGLRDILDPRIRTP